MSHPVADDKRPPRLKTVLSGLVSWITPACKEVVRLTSEQHDHPLPPVTKLRLALHRRFCVWCARYAKQLGVMHEAMHQLPIHLEQVSKSGLSADRKARLKRALEAESRGDS